MLNLLATLNSKLINQIHYFSLFVWFKVMPKCFTDISLSLDIPEGVLDHY